MRGEIVDKVVDEKGAIMNPNKALWEKCDFTEEKQSFSLSG
jgi:hypothetical protein